MKNENFLSKVFLYLEGCEIFNIIQKTSKSWKKVVDSKEFLLEFYKINFKKTPPETKDIKKLIIDTYVNILSFKVDLIQWKPRTQTNYVDFYNWIVKYNFHSFLHQILRDYNIKNLVKSLIPIKGDLILFKTDLENHKIINKIDPMKLIYLSIVNNSLDCLNVILDHFDGPLYQLGNPSFLFVNSYYERRAPIHTCAFYGRLNFLKYLQLKGANLKLKEATYGQTILHIATSRNHFDIVEWLLRLKIIEPNTKDIDYWTPVDIATSKSFIDILNLLKKYNEKEGREINEKNKKQSDTFISVSSVKKENIIKNILNENSTQFKWKSFDLEDNEILKYKKGKLVGKGTFGKVYISLKKEKDIVALKEIFCQDSNTLNFCYQECLVAMKLNHPNILKNNNVFTINDENGEGLFVYIESEYYNLGDLSNFMSKYDLDEHLIITFCIQILSGIHYLHSKKIVHRDIKPQNILLRLNQYKNDFELCIGDLGASKSFSSIRSGSIAGTEYYAAP